MPQSIGVFGFARFKNDEYTLYLRLFGFARLSLVWTSYLASVWVRSLHCIKRVFGFARFKNEEGHCI